MVDEIDLDEDPLYLPPLGMLDNRLPCPKCGEKASLWASYLTWTIDGLG